MTIEQARARVQRARKRVGVANADFVEHDCERCDVGAVCDKRRALHDAVYEALGRMHEAKAVLREVRRG